MPILIMRWAWVTAMIAFFVLASAGSLPAAEDKGGLRIAQDASTISVLDGDRPVFRYRYGDVPMKPYADLLASPSGVQILRDAPSDHKHHHGLMFALAADKIDFWMEIPDKCGKQLPRGFPLLMDAPTDAGRRRVGFVEELNWVGPGSDNPVLFERRVIAVIQGVDLGATLLEWNCRLTPPSGKDSVELGGAHYFGLGMRLITSMDKGGRFFNADDKEGPIVRGDERVTPTKWCAYTAKADGRPVTVAIFDAPTNLRHPAAMFTMQTPFAYLSATLNEWKEPITVEAGKPLDLRYGVALWDGDVDKATIENLYNRWVKLAK